jgi:P27 family predicted phage terminase small subunit
MKGRKPTPAAVRKLSGNPGKRPLPAEIPVPAGLPHCPEHLTPEARAEWDRMIRELDAAGIITVLDRSALALYCTAWGRWVTAEKALKKKGPIITTKAGNIIQNPALSIANQAMTQMQRMLVEFGLTPSSRARVKPAKVDEPDDPLADLSAPAPSAAGINTPGPVNADTPAPSPVNEETLKPARKPKAKK